MILGKHIDRKPLRHLSGRVFSTVLNLIFPMNVYDSQCGFKIFSRVKYEMIKDKITNMRWLWDTQLLILFYFNSYKIIEYPIDWHEEGDSKVKIFSDSFKMIFDLLIFKNKMREYGYKRI